MSKKKITDLTVFDLSSVADKQATLYSRNLPDDQREEFIFIGQEQYEVEYMALAKALDNGDQEFQGFRFSNDERLEGFIRVLQRDEHYLVLFATEVFSDVNPGAQSDLIVLHSGNALEDVA